MKNKFYSYFFREFFNNFLTVLFTLSAISWLIQAVNYFDYVTEKKTIGINAMSISDISGIPRATVIRKLKLLVKKKLITVDDKKLYVVNKAKLIGGLIKEQTEITKKLSNYGTKMFNAMMV